MYGYISGDVAAGKKSNEELSISTDDFTLTGFDSIDNIKLQVSFYDSDTYDTLIDDGILDSFAILSIVSELQDTYDITITPADIIPENFNSAKALWDMVCRLKG